MRESSFILWRRIDRPGHEAARLDRLDGGWKLAGTAVFAADGGDPCALDYDIRCDGAWRTLSTRVTGWIGARPVDALIEASEGRWRLNGEDIRGVDGAIDVDLNFSPSTNILPIRRLGLGVGQEAAVMAAWLRFPGFQLEPLEQTYRRTGPARWRYESAKGTFVRDLEVREDGFVTSYPDFWSAEE